MSETWKPMHEYKLGDEVVATVTPRPRWWMRFWYWTTRQPWPKETNLYRLSRPCGTSSEPAGGEG
jgi:hypothetical protein